MSCRNTRIDAVWMVICSSDLSFNPDDAGESTAICHCAVQVKVLFEETFHSASNDSYNVLCLESFLGRVTGSVPNTLKSCIVQRLTLVGLAVE